MYWTLLKNYLKTHKKYYRKYNIYVRRFIYISNKSEKINDLKFDLTTYRLADTNIHTRTLMITEHT